jgi:Cu/Ag efflux protein CusF
VKQVSKTKRILAMKRIAVLSMIALMLALGVAPPAAFSQSLDTVIGQVTKIDPTTDKIAIKHVGIQSSLQRQVRFEAAT